MLLHLETSSSLSCNKSNQTNMAHALDALKERLGLTNYTPQLDDIFGAQWSHLTPSEKKLFNRLSGYVQSELTAGSSRSSLWLSPQDLLFEWLTLDDKWDALNFKWRTVENLQFTDLSPAEQAATWTTLNFKWRTVENLQWTDLSLREQAALDAPDTRVYRDGKLVSGRDSARLLVSYLSIPCWSTGRPGMNWRQGFGLKARPFPENFRSLSNAAG
jgi:hypothetical protein